MRFVLITFFILFLNACSHAADVQSSTDISFGSRKDQKLDIYKPEHAAQNLPVIVFFYGGAYTVGTKGQYFFVGNELARNGYIAVIPDYRKYPEVKFPDFVKDGAAALSWVVDHIAEYGGDPKQIYVAGHSAGAHIGALLAVDPSYLDAFGKSRSVIRAFAGLAGPYAFTPTEKKYIDIFGSPNNYAAMRVPNYIDGKQPPMLLMMGETDEVVGRSNLDELKAAIDAKGGCVQTKLYPHTGHVAIIKDLSRFKSEQAPVLRDIQTFFAKPCS